MKLLTLLLLLISTLFAKPHDGSFKLMHFPKSMKNSFKTTIEVKYSIDSLMAEPLVKAQAKYSIMGLVNIDGEEYDLSDKKLDKLKIYDLKLKVPFESNTVHKLLYIEIDMGAMGKRGSWSYNTPSSPNWSKWIQNEIGDYLSAKEAKKAYKGFQRLGVDDTLGSLASVLSIKYSVGNVKKKKKVLKNIWLDEETDLMWQDEVYNKKEIDNYTKHYKKYKNIGKTGSWYHANNYCERLILNKFSNWRLPSIKELDKIKYKWKTFENKIGFKGTWSSTENGIKAKNIAMYYFDKNQKYIINEYKKEILYIRCIRSIR